MRVSRTDFDQLLAPHRADIVTHCYRMLGSFADAEDMAQETLARAWEARHGFEGNSSIRTWVHRIATNVCLDELRTRKRRFLPTSERTASDPSAPIPAALELTHWVGPFPTGQPPASTDPEAKYSSYESIALAFIAALQNLSPRQRAVLISRDVLGWEATEVARHLDVTVSSVNSLLHRARSRLRELDLAPQRATTVDERALLNRYVAAWVADDARALASLLREDATFSMPPQPAWFQGRKQIGAFMRTHVFTGHRWRLIPTSANGQPAFGVYRETAGRFEPHALHVLELSGGAISSIVCFLEPSLLDQFGLLDAGRPVLQKRSSR